MKKYLTKVISMLFVSAFLASTVSAADIITGTVAITPPDIQPCSGCYIEVIVPGSYIEHWDSNVMWNTSFIIDSGYEDYITNVYANGHAHSGTLTSWQLWDYDGWYREESTGQFSYDKVYYNSTAKYYGYLNCAG